MLKKRIPIQSILTLLFFITITSFYAFFQREPHLSSDNIPNRIINDEIYARDSVRLLNFWDLYWRYDNNDLHDSAIIVCNKMIDLGKELISFRYDSVLYERYAKAYGGIGYHLMNLGDYENSLRYSLLSYDLLTEKFGENHIRVMEVLTGIAGYYTKKGDYDLALKYTFKSLEIRKKTLPRTHHYLGNVYQNLSYIYEVSGDYNNAIRWCELAVQNHKIARRPGSKNGILFPRTMQQLANIYLLKGQPKKAEEIILESVILNNIAKGSTMFNTMANYWLAKIYFQTEELEKAKVFYDKFLNTINTHSETREDAPIEGDGFYGLGEIEEKRGNNMVAQALYDKAIKSWIKHYGTGGRNRIVRCLHQKAKLFLDQNDFTAALDQYQQALRYQVPAFNDENIFSVPPIDQITSSVPVLKTIELKTITLFGVFVNSGDIEIMSTILASAELFIDLAIKLQENYQWDNSKYSLLEKIKPMSELYLKTANLLYLRSGEQAYLDNIFSIIQKSKATILQETVKELQAKELANISSENRAKENRLKEKLAQYEKEIFDNYRNINLDNTDEIVDLNTKALDIKLAIDSLHKDFKNDYPEYLNSKVKKTFTSIDDLKKQLPSNTGIIEYFLGDSTLYIFTITRTNTHFESQSIDDGFIKRVIDFRKVFQNYTPGIKKAADLKTDYKLFIQNGRVLFDELLANILPDIKAKKIIIIPDGELSYLPFHVLLTKNPDEVIVEKLNYSNLPYLFLEKNIRYEFSASFIQQGIFSNKPKNIYVGFAPEYGGDLLAARGYSGQETFDKVYRSGTRASIGKLLFNAPEVITGADITGGKQYSGINALESIFKKQAKNHNILHLAGHYLVNDEAPLYSMFLFGQEQDTLEDGNLFVYELYNMQLNSDLAILSGCDTGNGKLQKGEGVLSLSRAFKSAGCPNIVMSQWKADDESCKIIMTSFLENLKQGMEKDKALKEARKHYLENALDENTHPYYWANFMLIGNDEPINFGNDSRWWWLIGGLLIIAIILGAKGKYKNLLFSDNT